MKFINYYLSQAARTLSAIAGLLVGGASGLLLGWMWGVLIGCGVALFASVVIPFIVYRQDLPYLKMKESLQVPFLIDQRVRFSVKDGICNGYLILTANRIVILSLIGKEEHRAEFSKQDIVKISLENETGLTLFLNQTQCVKVFSVFAKEMLEVFRQNGWT